MDKRSFMMHVRLALTGQTVGPSIFKVMEVLGKERTIKRLLDYANRFDND